MKYRFFNLKWDASHKIAVLSVTTNVIALIVILFLSATLSKKNERIVVVPTTVNRAFEIQWEHASAEYYKEMALWFSGMMGQVTPKTATNTANTLEPFLAPNIRKQVVEGIHASVAMMPTKVNYVAWFLPYEHSYEPSTRKIFVSGRLNSSLTSSKHSEKYVTYEFRFRMADGKPLVTEFTSYEGAPRTELYILANKQKIQQEQQMLDQQRDQQNAVVNYSNTNQDIQQNVENFDANTVNDPNLTPTVVTE